MLTMCNYLQVKSYQCIAINTYLETYSTKSTTLVE